MRKFELFELVIANKPREKEYLIDGFVRSYGYDVVRIPLYMWDFNLIELVWAKIKQIMREGNTTENYSLLFTRNYDRGYTRFFDTPYVAGE